MASSAPNGSSISMIFGSCTSARQIEARCCMPPESCHGSFFSNPSRPTSLQQRHRARQIFFARQSLHVDRQHHVAEDVAPRQQQRVLEHDADIAVRFCHLLAFDKDFAGRWRQQAGDHFQQRGLAAAGRADHDEEFAFIDVKIQRPQRRHIAVARPVGLRHAGEFESPDAPRGRVRHDAQMRARLSIRVRLPLRSFSARPISADSRWYKTPSDCPWPWLRARHTRPSG